MSSRLRNLGFAALAVSGLLFALTAASAEEHASMETTCAACHTCDKPTAEEPCLRKCIRTSGEGADEKMAATQSAPDVIVIDKMSELYMPVVFPHRLHATMEAMATGCSFCHHHETGEKPQPCGACHGDLTKPGNLWKPSLRGAYHRQCLGCHRDWSGETGCAICHAERAPGQPVDIKGDGTDITGRLHPNVQEPEKKVYPTPELEEGTMVTFHHKEHVQLFGKRCVDCHMEENCSRCHKNQGEAPKHERKDPHQDCAKCHNVDGDCTTCHTKDEAPGFDHAKRSGFALKAYHEGVACRKCHTAQDTYKGLRKQCDACHAADWAPAKFDHARTGTVTLDKEHAEIGCAGCHPKGMGGPVDCESCHEKDYVYPKKLPGTLLNAPPAPQ